MADFSKMNLGSTIDDDEDDRPEPPQDVVAKVVAPAVKAPGASRRPVAPSGPKISFSAGVPEALVADDEPPQSVDGPESAAPQIVVPRLEDGGPVASNVAPSAGSMADALRDSVAGASAADATSRIVVSDMGDTLKISMGFADSAASNVKTVPGGKYDGETKDWYLPKASLSADVVGGLSDDLRTSLADHLPEGLTVSPHAGVQPDAARIGADGLDLSDIAPNVAITIERQRKNFRDMLSASGLGDDEIEERWREYNSALADEILPRLSFFQARRADSERQFAAASQNAAEGSAKGGLLSRLFGGMGPSSRPSGMIRGEEAAIADLANFSRQLSERVVSVKHERSIKNSAQVALAATAVGEAVIGFNDRVYASDAYAEVNQAVDGYAAERGVDAALVHADIRAGRCPAEVREVLEGIRETLRADPEVSAAHEYLLERERAFEDRCAMKTKSDESLNMSLDPSDPRYVDVDRTKEAIDDQIKTAALGSEVPVVNLADKEFHERVAEMARRIKENIEAAIERLVSRFYAPANDAGVSGPAAGPRMGMGA